MKRFLVLHLFAVILGFIYVILGMIQICSLGTIRVADAHNLAEKFTDKICPED
jgi:hypothetical protein